jgi:hypothetical protein
MQLGADGVMDAMADNLRFIETKQLRTTEDEFDASTVVVGPADRVFGKLVGALVDPPRRQARFLVVESRRTFAKHQYVVPFDTARFDSDRNALRVDAGPDTLHEVRVDQLERFSDKDLLDAMFAPYAA